MDWYWGLAPVISLWTYLAWKAKDARSRYRWTWLQHACLSAFAAGVFLNVVTSTTSPLRWLSLLMLLMSFLAGAVACVYYARWRATPPGVIPWRRGALCPKCQDVVDTPAEAFHHIRHMHPDWHEEVMEAVRRRRNAGR